MSTGIPEEFDDTVCKPISMDGSERRATVALCVACVIQRQSFFSNFPLKQ
jgi:hypothetical protein